MDRADRSSLLALAGALERRDLRLAAELDLVAGLWRRLQAVRARARRIEETSDRAARDQDHVQGMLGEIEALLRPARRAADLADGALADDADERRLAAVQTRAAANALEERRRRAAERLESLAGETRQAEDEVRALAGEADAISARMRETPRLAAIGGREPGTGLGSIALWAEPAQAALLLARSALEEERQRTVREAAEAVSAALGEAVALGSVGRLRRRLEQETT